MSTAVDGFVEAATVLLGHASAVAGAVVKWKDADLILRHAMPTAIRAHRDAVCVAAQVRAMTACRATCLPDQAWWQARDFAAHWRSCHAQVEEFIAPVRSEGDFLGTILIGPFGPGTAAGTAERPRVERVAAWVADSLVWLTERRDLARSGARQAHGRHPVLQQALALVTADARRDLDLASVARQVGLSPTRLTHLCRTETGRSFSQWRDAAVLARAQALLSAHDLGIAAVATRCGYANAAHFSTAFKRASGCSPTEFRRRTQQGESP